MPVDDKVGYVRPELDDLREQTNQLFFNEYGDGIDMQDNQISGMFAGVMAQQWDKLEQVAQGVCHAMLTLTSKGANLDDRAAEAHISRKPETYASTELQITGYLQALIPEGTEFSTDSGIVFATAADVTIATQSTIAGDNETTEPLTDDDGDALGQAAVAANALETGVDGNVMPNTIVNPEEAIDGFYAVTNPEAAVGGSAAETDQELQLRVVYNQINKPNSTDSGIETAIKNIAGVRDAHMVSNREMKTDEYGNPPKTSHLYVIGGADEDIAAAYLHYRPLLANTIGSISATATDIGGKVKTINFDRAKTVPIYITVSLKVDGTVFDTDNGPIAIKQNIVSYFDTLTMGEGVPYSKMFGPAYSQDGVKDVSVALGVTADGVKEQDISISSFELAVTSIDNVTVNFEEVS
ncbi:baseplate J/gp47 family protein [Levilactobacillus wangkuiensis]|uniref:baseplate J/gp47 family protein n=1 Tax=Levilactobacillus wangkuiensis TaxID=2799566 RepID=UPI0019509391|nr:baseplate J/gp47 family protein [Levilactobacillus wangkuiensis]